MRARSEPPNHHSSGAASEACPTSRIKLCIAPFAVTFCNAPARRCVGKKDMLALNCSGCLARQGLGEDAHVSTGDIPDMWLRYARDLGLLICAIGAWDLAGIMGGDVLAASYSSLLHQPLNGSPTWASWFGTRSSIVLVMEYWSTIGSSSIPMSPSSQC